MPEFIHPANIEFTLSVPAVWLDLSAGDITKTQLEYELIMAGVATNVVKYLVFRQEGLTDRLVLFGEGLYHAQAWDELRSQANSKNPLLQIDPMDGGRYDSHKGKFYGLAPSLENNHIRSLADCIQYRETKLKAAFARSDIIVLYE